MAQAMIDFQNFFSISKSEQSGTGKRNVESIEHHFRRDRKSARPKFLLGRSRRSKKKEKCEIQLQQHKS